MILGILLLAAMGSAQAALYSFGTSGEYDANFREILNVGSVGYNVGGYISNTGSNVTTVVAFDTDGAGAGMTAYPITVGTTLSVSAEVRFSHTGSFGFYFSTNGGGSTYLALLNPNQTGSNELFRIFSGGSMSAGSTGTQNFSNTSDTVTLGAFSNFGATFQALDADSIRISMTSGAQTFSFDYDGVTLPTSVEIGVRSYNPTATGPSLDMDNFTVTDPIPEPSVIWSGGLGVLGLLARRRR